VPPPEKDTSTPDPLASKARRQLVENAGHVFEKLGVRRSTGQIYGLLYLSKAPMTLDDIVASLQLSKGCASNGTQQLLSFGAIRQVWTPGEHKYHFESVGDVSSTLRTVYQQFLQPRLSAPRKTLLNILTDLDEDQSEGLITAEDAEFCRQRLETLAKVQKRIERLAPLAEKAFI
jgi:HTH-type transcriptional regulator, glycine betaine synthesis regulator